jgi:hypothetical protein
MMDKTSPMETVNLRNVRRDIAACLSHLDDPNCTVPLRFEIIRGYADRCGVSVDLMNAWLIGCYIKDRRLTAKRAVRKEARRLKLLVALQEMHDVCVRLELQGGMPTEGEYEAAKRRAADALELWRPGWAREEERWPPQRRKQRNRPRSL